MGFWQVVKADKLSAMADQQHFDAVSIPAIRGEIFFQDGTKLAANRPAFVAYADKREPIKAPEKIVDQIAKIIWESQLLPSTSSGVKKDYEDQTKNRISGLLADPGLIWVSVSSKISPETKLKLDGLSVPWLAFEEASQRFYPESSTAAHLLGFVGSDDLGLPKGYFGLEGYYDRELSGREGKKRLERDAFGRPIPIGSESEIPPIPGRSIATSLDRNIQRLTEEYLSEGISQWGAESGTAIVLETKTGNVKAMASLPSYYPGSFSLYPEGIFKNPAVAAVYEPGSIMKPLVMAAAINEGKLESTTTCPVCSKPREIGGGVIRTFNNQYHPNLTMTEVLVNSDNTGMVFVGEKLGKVNLFDYFFKKYGFGEKTGIDLQEEEEGTVKSKSQWYPLDVATLTFGQGIGVTPIQMITAFSVLANGGQFIPPRLVAKIYDGNREIAVPPKSTYLVLSKKTADTLAQMLLAVTDGSPLKYPRDRVFGKTPFPIAAKSGTAQISVKGEYVEGKTIGSVIGYVPATNPRFVVYVKLNEPAVRSWGSDTAGPVFFKIMKDLILYYGLTP